MAQVHVYSLDAVKLSIAGILIEAGGGEDGFFELTLPEGFGAKSGVHGDVASYKLGAGVAEGKLTLLDPSSVNEDLFELYQADRDSDSGSGVGDFQMEDLNSHMEITGQCRLTQPPAISKTAEVQSFVWALHVYLPRVVYRERAVAV